nr:auxin response factor 2 [Paeonia lactiflora]
MGVLIDLNTVDDDETPSSGSSSFSAISSPSSSAPAPISPVSSSVCLELWHACAGPLISLPKKGSVVVYFPQGHLEVSDSPSAACDLPPHVFSRVVDVKLHAEVATDEVYAQVSLVPETQIEQRLREVEVEVDPDGDEDDIEGAAKSMTPHMFCKTLTASDTSTHGGFSVPRRAAEDCFPPLDYKQQRPSQELVAKDLHGLEWRFRHIYRGQPRRHLLTTGWSAFVNKKKLVSGDAVLFLRGGDGELRLGIRRAAQVKGGPPFEALCSQQLNLSNFSSVANAISTGSVFNIYYNPRASLSEFIIPFSKFSKSLDHSFSVGARFKMRFETEDSAERRYTGLITGISDMDPVRWPGSKWRCLVVRWDDAEANRHSRVSPWEIESSGSSSFSAPCSKRTRTGVAPKPDFPIPNGIGMSDFGESLRFQKVLQGQEIMGFHSNSDTTHPQNHHATEKRRCYPGSDSSGISSIGNSIRNPLMDSDISYYNTGFGESFGFHKVLQGQENFSSRPYGRVLNGGLGAFDSVPVPSPRNGPSTLMHGYNSSSPSSVLMFQQANSSPFPDFSQMHTVRDNEKELSQMHGFRRDGYVDHQLGIPNHPLVPQSEYMVSQDLLPSCKNSCRLFGFSLTDGGHAGNTEKNPNLVTSSPSSFVPRFEQQLYPRPPPVMSNPVGGNCTNFYAVRDTLLDIAL